MTRKSVQGGYCQYPDTVGCALTAAECDDPDNYLSARQLQSGPTMAHGGSCRWQNAIKSTKLGMCTDQDGSFTQCSSSIDACPRWDGKETVFDGDADQKGWVSNNDCTVETTLFGRCDYGMCSWSHEFCVEDNTFRAFDEGCTCDKVQVGACVSNKDDGTLEAYCSVSYDGCDDIQDFIMPTEVMGVAGFDCYLCREERDVGETSLGLANDTNPISNMNNQTTIIVVSTLGGLLIAGIIGLVVWRLVRTKKAVKRATDSVAAVAAPPTGTIKINSENSETGGVMDDDSVLSDGTG